MEKRLILTIPVRNEEKRVEKTVKRLIEHLTQNCKIDFMIVLAEDGSTDQTLEIINALKEKNAKIAVVSSPRSLGKGLALKRSWARYPDGDYFAFMDADLAVPLVFLDSILRPVISGDFDAAIGSRYAPHAGVKREVLREVFSRSYNKIVNGAFKTPFADHQCGFKVFSKRFFNEVILPSRSEAWFFDTEWLVLGRDKGFKTLEVPVSWVEKRNPPILSQIKRVFKDVHSFSQGLISLAFQSSVFRPYIELLTFCIFGAFGFFFVLGCSMAASLVTQSASMILLANSAAVFTTMVIQFFLNRKFTFKKLDKPGQRLLLDLIGRSLGFLSNLVIMVLLMDKISLTSSIIVANVSSMFFNYLFNKLVVFGAGRLRENVKEGFFGQKEGDCGHVSPSPLQRVRQGEKTFNICRMCFQSFREGIEIEKIISHNPSEDRSDQRGAFQSRRLFPLA